MYVICYIILATYNFESPIVLVYYCALEPPQPISITLYIFRRKYIW